MRDERKLVRLTVANASVALDAAITPVARSREAARRITAAALLGDVNEVVIEHNGRDYHLRLTSQGKLQLTA